MAALLPVLVAGCGTSEDSTVAAASPGSSPAPSTQAGGAEPTDDTELIELVKCRKEGPDGKEQAIQDFNLGPRGIPDFDEPGDRRAAARAPDSPMEAFRQSGLARKRQDEAAALRSRGPAPGPGSGRKVALVQTTDSEGRIRSVTEVTSEMVTVPGGDRVEKWFLTRFVGCVGVAGPTPVSPQPPSGDEPL